MLRRDYILRMIEEFVRVLARIKMLKREGRVDEAQEAVKESFQTLLGMEGFAALQLSETELLATLLKRESYQAIREKSFLLVRFFMENGELSAARGQSDLARAYYLKGLRFLLHTLRQGDPFELPEFAPKVDELLHALETEPLPLQVQGQLMEYYERTGQFAKAEDALYSIANVDPTNPALREFGLAFYSRLRSFTDEQLLAGNFSREEIATGLAEFEILLTSSGD
jgi:hypothetical protein